MTFVGWGESVGLRAGPRVCRKPLTHSLAHCISALHCSGPTTWVQCSAVKPSRLGAMAMQALALILLGLAASASAQYSSCPEPYGLQLYPHEQYCDKFYKCANGELSYFLDELQKGLRFQKYLVTENRGSKLTWKSCWNHYLNLTLFYELRNR